MGFPGRRLLVITGDGKGKTTAALGLVLRAVGQGQTACCIHFLKSDRRAGEYAGLARLGVEVAVAGLGFVPKPGHPDYVRHQAAAQQALALARERLASGACDLVILDEALGAVRAGLFSEADLLAALAATAPRTSAAVTGRGGLDLPGLLALADTVSEIRDIQHALRAGTAAQPGIEY